MSNSTVQPQPYPKLQSMVAPAAAGSDAAASQKSAQAQKRTVWGSAKPQPKSYYEKVTVAPLGNTKKSFMKSVVQLFSANTFKKVAPYVATLAAGITVGSLITALAGPHIAAIAVGVAASSAFPPVGIAIASTLGAVLLAYGLYRTVKYFQDRLAKADKAEKQAQDEETGAFGDIYRVPSGGSQVGVDKAESISPDDSISVVNHQKADIKPLN